VARHLKTTDNLFDDRSSPRTEAMVAAAVQWAERIAMMLLARIFLFTIEPLSPRISRYRVSGKKHRRKK
jgi:hypothetical protein